MIPVLELKQPELREQLDAHLQRCGIEHDWIDDDDRLILTVPTQDLLEPARRQTVWALHRASRDGGPRGLLHKRPLTLLLMGICLLVTVLMELVQREQVLGMLTISSFSVDGQYLRFDTLQTMLSKQQYWRLLTPVFLHFSALHLTFNLLWLWILGSAVEFRHGAGRLLVLLVVCGVLSNLAQYQVSGPLFGGMSGVVYGLLGYCWVWRRRPDAPVLLPTGLYVFMLAWLALGYTGFSEWLGLGRMANAAHLGGLVSGAACGLLALSLSAAKGKPSD